VCSPGTSRAQSFLEGALEVDPTSALASESLATGNAVLGDGRVFEVADDRIGCAPTRAASAGGGLPALRSARLESAALVVPRASGGWTALHALGWSGAALVEASLDCESGLGATRPVDLPSARSLDLGPRVHRILLEDGSILAVAHGSGSDLDEARYSTLVRLVPGPTRWTAADVLSTRSLRSLIDPATLADFDRRLRQQLRIDDVVLTDDGAAWIAVRQLDDASVRGTWLVRWHPAPDWSGADVDVVAAFGEGPRVAVELAWAAPLGILVIDRTSFVDPAAPAPAVLTLPSALPSLVPAHDGRLWTGLSSPSPYERRLAPLAFVPAVADLDGDTLRHDEERAAGSSDARLDSDADGVLDVLERHLFDTRPSDAASRPADIDVARVPRFGFSTRVHSSAFAAAHARLTYESSWSSSPYLCAYGSCLDGRGERRELGTTDEVAAMTADGTAWIGRPRAGAGIRFFDGARLEESVSALLALSGQLGASERGFVRPAGITPYAPTLPDRAAPFESASEPVLLGVDDASGEVFVGVTDARGQLVLRTDAEGRARSLFRPGWLGLSRVEWLSWLDRHGLYLARAMTRDGAPAEYVLLDRAMRAVGRTDPPMDGGRYVVGRFFGRGYAVVGPGPVPAVGDFYTWMHGELVERTTGLDPGDVLLWGSGAVSGLWIYREDGTAYQLASVAELDALGGGASLAGVDVVQLDVRAGATEVCLAATSGALHVIGLESGVPTSVTLARAAGALGCAYDEAGALHWLHVSEGRASVRTSSDEELASATLEDEPRGLFRARDAAGRVVWIVDTVGASFDDPSEAVCLREGSDPARTGFDAAGLAVQRLSSAPDVVAWIDAVRDSDAVTTGTVQAALVDDFCAGRAAERAHSPARPDGQANLFHQAYERLVQHDGRTPTITVNEAAFGLRPDGRFLFAARSLRVPSGVGQAGMLMQQAGAWLHLGPGSAIDAHAPWRRPEPGSLTLALAYTGVRALTVVPGDTPSGWGSRFWFDATAEPAPTADGGTGEDASTPVAADAGEPSPPPTGCACRALTSDAGGRAPFALPLALCALAAGLARSRRRRERASRAGDR
jgi:hypothetical protein